jgi:hypothetical protein
MSPERRDPECPRIQKNIRIIQIRVVDCAHRKRQVVTLVEVRIPAVAAAVELARKGRLVPNLIFRRPLA